MKNKIFLVMGMALIISLPQFALAKTKAAESASPAASASPTASASSAKKDPRPGTFHGMATGADQKAQTFTIAGKEKPRVFKVTTRTKITKAGNPATLADIVDNTEISGAYWAREDGTLEAKTVKLGPVREKKEKKKDKTSESPAASASPKS